FTGAARHIKHRITCPDAGVLDQGLRDGTEHCANGTGMFLPVRGRLAPLAQDLVCLTLARFCVQVLFASEAAFTLKLEVRMLVFFEPLVK
ncbi:MAG: hypothetical protein ABR501_14990, partial [Pyrinomonadaceae bacterium]